MGAPVGDLRRALHEVVVRRAKFFEHVTLPPERAVIFRAALEELQSHRGSVKDRDSAVNHATTTRSNLKTIGITLGVFGFEIRTASVSGKVIL